MKKQILNLITNIKSDSNEAAKLAREIANIPAIDITSIKVWTAPTSEKTGEFTSVEFMGIHAKFTWHDHTIVIEENHNGKLVVYYDEQKIGEIFWSALWGKLESISNYTELKITKAQDYILDTPLSRQWMLAAPPIIEVGPPVQTDEASLVRKEFSIDTPALLDYRPFPFPQRPLPRAIGEHRVAAFLGQQRFGSITLDATLEQRQEPHLSDAFNQLRAGMNQRLLFPTRISVLIILKVIYKCIHIVEPPDIKLHLFPTKATQSYNFTFTQTKKNVTLPKKYGKNLRV